MDLPQFVATTPAVIPATDVITYDKYWLTNMRIDAGNPTRPVRLVAVFSPARDVTTKDKDGNDVTVKELMPNAQPKRLIIEDLFTEAESDLAGLGATMGAVLTVLKNRATVEGIL